MKFGVGFPTCREGTAYPVPYIRPDEFPDIARRAEQLGLYALWGNSDLAEFWRGPRLSRRAAQIRAFEQRTGVEHMRVIMLGETTEELVADMERFAQEVMPAFADTSA